jgi:inosine-uridine nucleoside N-ribohydrolase
MKRIILDCDPGVDDALAIIMALNSENLILEGITTVYGNSSVEQTTANVLKLMDYFGLNIPVAKGSDKPLKLERIDAKSVHGNDGLGDTNILSKSSSKKLYGDAIQFILEKVKSGEVKTIVATGPLTNIATAFQADKESMSLLDELVIMGGAIFQPGNIDRRSEFNFYADPHAADYVLQQPVKKILIPLDVTHQVILTPNHLRQMPDNKTTILVKAIVKKYQKYYIDFVGFDGNALHDPLAIGYSIDSSFVTTQYLDICVETEGKYTRGECVVEERSNINQDYVKPNVHVALKVSSDKFLEYFIKNVTKIIDN